MKQGDRITLDLTAQSARGEGIGLVDARQVHVHGAFVGERVQVRIDSVSRQHPRAFGTLLEVIDAHPARREAPCPQHFERGGRCTGCPMMTLDPEAQRALKRGRALQLGLESAGQVRGGSELGYRWSSKRVVGGRPGALVLGSYVRGTHRVADMRGCLVEHPRIADAANAIADIASAQGLEPDRDLRYVWLKTDGERVLVALLMGHPDGRAAQIVDALPDFVAVTIGVQDDRGNAIRGNAPHAVRGPETLDIALDGYSTQVGALGFLQPNPLVAAAAYAALLKDTSGRRAFDLYAGAGITTAMLRRRFDEVLPCESYPESAAALGVAPQDAHTFLLRHMGEPVDLVVANPPRAGFGPGVTEALVRLDAPRIHIMSCDADTLARDLALLDPSYVVESIETFDTLPQTAHLELVARLKQRGS